MAVTVDLFHSGLSASDVSYNIPLIERTAVRATLLRYGRLLLLRSRHGDLKFPGGGVEPGETHTEALRRELAEECGLNAVDLGDELLTIAEYSRAREPGFVFKMTSHYRRCFTEVEPTAQRLDAYEAELALRSVWVEPSEALRTNERCLLAGVPAPWLRREILALRTLADVPI